MLSVYPAALCLLIIANLADIASAQARPPPRKPSVTVHGNATHPGKKMRPFCIYANLILANIETEINRPTSYFQMEAYYHDSSCCVSSNDGDDFIAFGTRDCSAFASPDACAFTIPTLYPLWPSYSNQIAQGD
jgi:hypothetical protein